MKFEWDEIKNDINIKKHGIAFENAARIFFASRIEKPAIWAGEERFLTIGEVNNRVITVVYTLRGENIRIISIRKARRNEEREFRSI